MEQQQCQPAMRSEQEMLDLILGVAKRDDRIRGVLLTGSRANPAVPRDRYQDYDVVYLVDELAPFVDNMQWIEQCFGKPIVMQLPDTMEPEEPAEARFTYLMIFDDGNRIDLRVTTRPQVEGGEPAKLLLDKTGTLPPLPPPSDACWWVSPPTQKQFSDCCNEFWWCLNNVGKGIARDELPYAMANLNLYVRDMLDRMTGWYIGTRTGFSVSPGKLGKYFKTYLPARQYEMYASTYCGGDYDSLWQAVFTTCGLFRTMALATADQLNLQYNGQEDEGMTAYLTWVRDNRNGPVV